MMMMMMMIVVVPGDFDARKENTPSCAHGLAHRDSGVFFHDRTRAVTTQVVGNIKTTAIIRYRVGAFDWVQSFIREVCLKRGSTRGELLIMGLCEGDCDHDGECEDGRNVTKQLLQFRMW